MQHAYISVSSVIQSLKERNWGLCAAMSTPVPQPFGPNQRRLRHVQSKPLLQVKRPSCIATCAAQLSHCNQGATR